MSKEDVEDISMAFKRHQKRRENIKYGGCATCGGVLDHDAREYTHQFEKPKTEDQMTDVAWLLQKLTPLLAQKEQKENMPPIGFNWDNFDMDKFFKEADEVGRIRSGVAQKEERCTLCGSPFQTHHHRHITSTGTFHTSCYKHQKPEKEQKNIVVGPPPIHTHYNDANQSDELCGRVVCPFGYVGVSVETPTPTVKEESHTQGWEEKLGQMLHGWTATKATEEKYGIIKEGEAIVGIDKLKAFIRQVASQEYYRGFDAGGQTKGGTGRIMYERGLVEGRLQGIAEAVAVVPEEAVGDKGCGDDVWDNKSFGISVHRDSWNDCRQAVLTAISALTHKKI